MSSATSPARCLSSKGYADVCAYCAAKHGVLGLTRALAAAPARKPRYRQRHLSRLHRDRYRVRDAAQHPARTGHAAEDARAQLVKHNPPGRLVQSEKVANAVLWLCRSRSGGVTGQAISIFGGENMQARHPPGRPEDGALGNMAPRSGKPPSSPSRGKEREEGE